MRIDKFLIVFCLFITLFIFRGYSQVYNDFGRDNIMIGLLRDSLDRVNYPIPSPLLPHKEGVLIDIRKQADWDNLAQSISKLIANGNKNILVRIKGKGIIYGSPSNSIANLDYPEVNLRIIGNNVRLEAAGKTFSSKDYKAIKDGVCYSFPYDEFSLNDIILDNKGNEVLIREDVQLVNGDIEASPDLGSDVWKFKVDLPELSESMCHDFYVLLTREWTSARHKVVKVKNGWLYFHLKSDDVEKDERNPNVDWQHFNVRPRYCLINSPLSKSVHVTNGRIYIPYRYKSIKIVKDGGLMSFVSCHFNSLEVSGFRLNGCGDKSLISIYSCQFDHCAFIRNNRFSNISGLAIYVGQSKNVTISNNWIKNTREGAIECNGENMTICGNFLKNIGWMLNTRAIIGGGNNLHICDNTIEDFNYAAINCGRRIANNKDIVLNYIVERNVVRLTKEYAANYLFNTLADGGGIYIGPQCTRGIIRNNVIENMKGIHSNRGIFLDDGAKNLAIYGNLIMNTSNSYDIDLRYTDTYADVIPDHNTNNSVFQNIMTGGYRFQDAGDGSNCIGGDNVLLGTGPAQKTVVELKQHATDVRGEDMNVETAIKRVPVDGFVKKQLKKKK